jgi:DNA-binding NarL/FixJ family response regulator
MSSRHRILIAEDHALLRAGIRVLLAAEPDLEVVGEADNGRDAVRLAATLDPDLVLMDISMPGTNGLESVVELKRRSPAVKVLIITMHKTDEYIDRALRNGVSGYMLKESSHDELRTAIRTVLAGKVYLSPDISARVVSSFVAGGDARQAAAATAWDTLSKREREVLKLVAEGSRNKQIAAYLSISIKTVEKHRSTLMQKLALHNAAMLTAYAMKRGIVAR